MSDTSTTESRGPLQALLTHKVAIGMALVAAIAIIAGFELTFARSARAEQASLAAETARIEESNAEIDRTVASPEAVAAWLEHVKAVDTLWAENLKKIPPSELVEQQYDKLARLTAASGIKQLSFERLNLSKVENAPGAMPNDTEPGKSVSPAIELRQVKISFLANVDSLAALLAEIQKGGDERMLSIAEYTVRVRADQPGYTIQVEMLVNVYFKKRDVVAVATAA